MAKRAFLSPIINPLMVALVRLVFPLLKRTIFGKVTIYISPSDLEVLKRYRGERMLLLPNHPSGEEPAVLFDIANQLNEVFNFVAAREIFDLEHGFRGWVLRRVGVYSVIRGATDRESFLMSKKILMEGKNRLVIFIEGEISRGNDTLIPFEPGVIQLACWAQEGLAREGRKQDDNFPPIYLAPVAIKYFYKGGYEIAIEQALHRLEEAVGITQNIGSDWYTRIRAIGEKVLQVQQEAHQIVVLPGVSINERVEAIKHRMLRKMELFLDLKPQPESPTLVRLREIRNTMDDLIHTYDDPTELTDYEKRAVEHHRLSLSEFYKDLDRVVYFLTYDEAYLRDNPTPERYIDVIRRLENEVFGVPRLRHPRVAVVKVGDIINLKENFPAYEADKKQFITLTADALEENTWRMLKQMTQANIRS